ncbi:MULTISPECIES: LysR family transcriptional regulator [Rhizobium/Agrobacterium group]|uniref:LysR family transcriptional regulator n=1 Tax=Rhizobium/Agrobacterium group TaxID=227290 RepID=UPI0003F1F3A6|nr:MULTISPECIES: LysR family transcriptional regulator [Rhizobium/Agrobacterium group]AHK04989.1 LysR family transcriptional regulator [Agrobacterium tumefaciens LBA4213 (Ach5)]AKC10722.1 LysR family transcriptional regulator [Agrobacterium tumefaciens]AYM20105.1 hypothetical protein At15955_51200 [Agrobacterium tumefaciens]AYM71408.1 hypothetical protein AtA6_51920 [Agrobacterium tumefaciens]QQE32029.1 LysR family transcriptional regulator [Agrobacterium tumefaciens]
MWRSARTWNKSNGFAQAQLGQIPLVALRHTVVVGDVLNFRHAASVLEVTQSSVSARIKAREEALGIILFERRHRGVRLTEAERRFIAEVSVGIEHLDCAARTAGAISHGGEGRLAIGLHASIAFGFLADLPCRFRAAYPGSEQEECEIDGMEGSRSPGARMASVRMDKAGAFEWKRSLLLASI